MAFHTSRLRMWLLLILLGGDDRGDRIRFHHSFPYIAIARRVYRCFFALREQVICLE